MEIWRLRAWLVSLLATTFFHTLDSAGDGFDSAQKPHIRQKRLLWITSDGRLALPPGTHLTITPSLSLPFVRYPPDGFLSNMSISLPFSIDFDLLGLTDNQNPYGVLPPLIGRSLGRKAGSYFADYVAQFLERKRTERSAPPTPKHSHFHGGERALLYTVVEDLLASFGMDGKACLLRAICEVHSHSSIQKFGLLGEMLQLFFSASKSPFAELLDEYVEAEIVGREKRECWPYFKSCPKSLFQPVHNKYTDNSATKQQAGDEAENEIPTDEDVSQLNIDLNQRNRNYAM
ncbi:uncharacterized protein LOC135839252 [Planococcus citri]|uniref:uncharacterized protein LOC135839252 n=1 Tax=Planococcus citri TaxID=170843 RepID=UPI0031F89199